MSYELEAYLVPSSVGEVPSTTYPLTDELGLVPLTVSVATSLSEDWPVRASRGTRIARVSADYFGDAGSQSATVWADGEVIADRVDVNEALRLLGVQAAEGLDEWDTVGLGRFRRTSTWASQAVRDARKKGPNPIPELLEALRYTSPDRKWQEKVRAGAAEDLGELRATESIPALVRAVKAKEELGVRIAAASALARMGGDGITALAELLGERETGRLKKRDPHRFFPIVHALGEAREAAAPAAVDLAKMLKHRSSLHAQRRRAGAREDRSRRRGGRPGARGGARRRRATRPRRCGSGAARDRPGRSPRGTPAREPARDQLQHPG